VSEKEPLATTKIDGDTIRADLWYPHTEPVKHVEIGLVDVRASDGIRVTYDFERDGWVICQPTKLCWACDDENPDMGWKEVAFVKSWALEAEQAENERRVNGEGT
jgi:hypothetical protein